MDQATKPEKGAEVSCLKRVRSTVNDRNGSSVSDSAAVLDLTPKDFETVGHERDRRDGWQQTRFDHVESYHCICRP